MADQKKKRRWRDTWGAVRSQSRLSIPQLVATALAAITMAIVSSRLTSFSSSLLIVGLISVVSALSSEFYRILLVTGTEKTKEVVAPIIEAEHEGHQSDATKVLVADAVASQESSPADTPSPEVVSAVEIQESEEGGGNRFWVALRLAMHNQVVQMAFVFLIVAASTVGVSYAVARAQGGGQYNTYTHVEQTLTEEDKQQILDEASARAKAENGKDDNAGQAQATMTDDPEATLASLEERMQQLQTENTTLANSIAELRAALEAEQQTVADLLARLEALETQPPAPATTPTD